MCLKFNDLIFGMEWALGRHAFGYARWLHADAAWMKKYGMVAISRTFAGQCYGGLISGFVVFVCDQSHEIEMSFAA